VVLALAWFATMGWRPLLEPDEGRYAEIPREMTASGDWVTPRLDGFKYFEKPPLVYWATAAAYSVFGVTEWTARFWPCAFAFLCLPLVYAFARHVYGSSGVAVAAVAALALNPYFVVVGQLNLLDSGLTFFMTAAVFAFLRAGAVTAQISGEKNIFLKKYFFSFGEGHGQERRWMILAALSLALAVLAKGIVALVLAGATVCIHMIITREVRSLRSWHLEVTIPVFLVVTVPWFVIVSRRNPEFLEFFFIHEHFARYLTNEADRVEAWWFFLPLLLLALLPWIVDVVPAAKGLRRGAGSPLVFLAIWCAFNLLFFSVSRSKLPTYILPMMPALAVLLAPHAAHLRRATWICLALVIVAAIGLTAAPLRRSQLPPTTLLAWVAVAITLAIVSVTSAKRSWMAPAAASILSFQALMMSYSALPPLRTAKFLVAATRPYITPGTALFSIGQYRQSIAPYLGRTLRPGLYEGELGFGIAHASGQYIGSLEEFASEWQRKSDAIAFVEPELVAKLCERGTPLRILARDDRTVAIARR
jgi:4-amino-4-deoxy-L-arabinose transferase-like glycosyltransferase